MLIHKTRLIGYSDKRGWGWGREGGEWGTKLINWQFSNWSIKLKAPTSFIHQIEFCLNLINCKLRKQKKTILITKVWILKMNSNDSFYLGRRMTLLSSKSVQCVTLIMKLGSGDIFIEYKPPVFTMTSQWIPHLRQTCCKMQLIYCFQTEAREPSLVIAKLGIFRSQYQIA